MKDGLPRSCAVVVALASLGWLPRVAHAAEAERATDAVADPIDAPPSSVELTLVGEAPGSGALLERVASWFRDPRVSVKRARAATLDAAVVFTPASAPGVKIWIWLRTQGVARIFVAAREPESGSERYWVSDVALSRGLDELGSEELAQVVHLSALAVWTGNLESKRSEVEARLDAASPQAPSAAPAPPATSSTRTRTLALGAEYSLSLAGEQGPAQVVGAVVGLGFRSAESELGLRAHVGALVPHHAETSQLALTLSGGAVALDAAAAFRASNHLWLGAAVGPGADIVHYEATGSGSLRAEPASTDLRPFMRAELGLCAELGSVTVGLSALISAQLLRVHYDVAGADGRSQVLTPWQFQPGLALSVMW